MGSLSQALDAAAQGDRARAGATRRRGSGSAACACAASTAQGALDALERARALAPSEEGLLDLALVANLLGDVGTEVSACEQATRARAGLAGARGRGSRTRSRAPTAPRECLAACERALALRDDPEVRDLREQVLAMAPRALARETAAA